ncbi:MAG: DUF58 domain-containing protein [Anaerolineales bacterium]|nr:DUF58 domain-containing protein [Anaerolineales bacterium]
MTGRAWHVSALIGLLVFLGLLTRNGNVLLLALPFVIYLGASALSAPAEDMRVYVKHALSANHGIADKPVHVSVVVQSQGAGLEELRVEDCVTPPLAISEGEASRSEPLPAGARLELEYDAYGQRGEYFFQGTHLTASDHFGLFQVQRWFDTSDRLLIYPEAARLRHVAIRPLRTVGFSGPIPARRGGSGTDFYGIRQYQTGETLRRINWRVTARHYRTIFTNEFERESVADVGLILDVRDQSDILTAEGKLSEYSVQAAGSLARLFLKEGHRVGLVAYGYGITQAFPGYGAVQLERIMATLARAQTGTSFAFENLGSLPTRFFPPQSQLVIVSPLLPEDLFGLLRLASLGYSILVVSPDPIHFEVRTMRSTENLEMPLRLARIERAVLLGKLRHVGIAVAEWQTDQPLDQTLYSSLARQPLRQHLTRMAQ